MTPSRVVNAENTLCPVPILEGAKAIRALVPGELLAIRATDPAFDADVRAWAARAGHELVELSREGDVRVALVRRR